MPKTTPKLKLRKFIEKNFSNSYRRAPPCCCGRRARSSSIPPLGQPPVSSTPLSLMTRVTKRHTWARSASPLLWPAPPDPMPSMRVTSSAALLHRRGKLCLSPRLVWSSSSLVAMAGEPGWQKTELILQFNDIYGISGFVMMNLRLMKFTMTSKELP
jgi:hypothetical protein